MKKILGIIFLGLLFHNTGLANEINVKKGVSKASYYFCNHVFDCWLRRSHPCDWSNHILPAVYKGVVGPPKNESNGVLSWVTAALCPARSRAFTIQECQAHDLYGSLLARRPLPWYWFCIVGPNTTEAQGQQSGERQLSALASRFWKWARRQQNVPRLAEKRKRRSNHAAGREGNLGVVKAGQEKWNEGIRYDER